MHDFFAARLQPVAWLNKALLSVKMKYLFSPILPDANHSNDQSIPSGRGLIFGNFLVCDHPVPIIFLSECIALSRTLLNIHLSLDILTI